MSEPTSVPRDSAAIAHVERRLWLLDLMLGLCAALLAVVRSNQASIAWVQWAMNRASAAIARVTCMAQMLKIETERQLRILRADVAHEAQPPRQTYAAPPAWRAERAGRTERAVTPARAPREAPAITGVDAAFRARVEALEAFLDLQGPNAALPAREAAGRLCGVLGLDPDWSRWLDEDWLAANFDLSRLPAVSEAGEGVIGVVSAPLRLPPQPHPSPPGPPAAEASFAVPDDPEIRKTYIPGFKETLAKRVFEAIESDATSEEEFTFLCGILEQRLAANEPYMWGCNHPLRGAVARLCEKLRVWPDWKRWQNDTWIDDGFNARRRNAEAEARLRAAGVDLGF